MESNYTRDHQNDPVGLWSRHVQSYTLAQGGSRLRADANPPARATPVRDGAEKFEATLIKPQALNPLNPKP
jgi:hypothetical protein